MQPKTQKALEDLGFTVMEKVGDSFALSYVKGASSIIVENTDLGEFCDKMYSAINILSLELPLL
jgi:hypothetical protein